MRGQLLPDGDREIFGAAHLIFHEIHIHVQVFVVQLIDHIFFDELAEFLHIIQKTGIRIRPALDGYIKIVIMPMPVLIGAYPKYGLIPLLAPFRVKEFMRRVKMFLPC
jgi:hypothetical protein